jgi:hypothetical protein
MEEKKEKKLRLWKGPLLSRFLSKYVAVETRQGEQETKA